MFNSFGNDDDWLEVSDGDGRKASMKHLATVQFEGKNYMILGAVKENAEGEPEGGVLVLREENASDRHKIGVIERDREKIERIIGTFIMKTIAEHIAGEEDFFDLPQEESACGMTHLPGEYCVCCDPNFLQ